MSAAQVQRTSRTFAFRWPTYSRSNLRSAQRGDMVVPRTRTQLGRRSFHVAASTSRLAGMPSLSTSAQHLSVKDNSELGWKPISSTKPTTSSENIVLRVYCTYLLLLASDGVLEDMSLVSRILKDTFNSPWPWHLCLWLHHCYWHLKFWLDGAWTTSALFKFQRNRLCWATAVMKNTTL